MPIIAIVLGLAIIVFGSYLIITKSKDTGDAPVEKSKEIVGSNPESDTSTTTSQSPQENNSTTTSEPSVTKTTEVQPIYNKNDTITPVKGTRQNTEGGQSTSPSDAKPTTVSSKTYTDEATYRKSDNTYTIDVTLEVSNGVVKSADVMYGNKATGYEHPLQERFDAVYKTEVIGKKLEDIHLSRVGGASLTSKAFNEAVADIIKQANT